MTVREQSVVEGADAVARLLDEGLAAVLDPEMAARWRLPRSQYRPRVLTSVDDRGIAAAALVTSRPATAAIKIVDLWWRDVHHGGVVLDAVLEMAQRNGAAVVKWEQHADAKLHDMAKDRGFTALQPTGWSHDATDVGGYALWLATIEHVEPRYYTQSTEFTCGAVAALVAVELMGQRGLPGDERDRRTEIDFWRAASNYPACEPVGLGVAMQKLLAGPHRVQVSLHPDTPVLVDEFEGFEREFRVELQQDSRLQASEIGVEVDTDRIGVGDIAQRIHGGDVALLLVTQTPMHGQNEPHWIAAHSSDGESMVVVSDPWLDVAGGETWVDAHELPIALTDLDEMCQWGSQDHRGVVFLSRRAPR